MSVVTDKQFGATTAQLRGVSLGRFSSFLMWHFTQVKPYLSHPSWIPWLTWSISVEINELLQSLNGGTPKTNMGVDWFGLNGLPAVFLAFLLPREPHQITGSILGISSQTHHNNGLPLPVTWCDVFMTSIFKELLVSTLFTGKAQKRGLGSTNWTENFRKISSCQAIWHHRFCRKKREARWVFLQHGPLTFRCFVQHISTCRTNHHKWWQGKKSPWDVFFGDFPTHSWHTPTLLSFSSDSPNRWRHSDLSSATCADWFNVSVILSRWWYTFWKSCPYRICPPLEKQKSTDSSSHFERGYVSYPGGQGFETKI